MYIINPIIIARNYHELFNLIRIVFDRDSACGLQCNYPNKAFLKSLSILFCCSKKRSPNHCCYACHLIYLQHYFRKSTTSIHYQTSYKVLSLGVPTI